MARATVHDVARAAGVSLATVDRVLNQRPGVRAATVARVQAAVRELGYARDAAAANLARRRDQRFLFLLPEGDITFFTLLAREIDALAGRPETGRAQIERRHFPAFDGAALARILDRLDPGEADGVALVAVDAPEVRAAIDALTGRGVAVVTLVSDLPNSRRDSFVGIDNLAAGRVAGALLGRFLGPGPARVAIVMGSMLVRDHAERKAGFEQVTGRDHPNLTLLPPVEGRDDPARTRAAVSELLAANPDLAGLYSIGAGNRGVIAALQAAGRAGRITAVAHEVTTVTREALADGTFAAIIHQDPGHEARSALRLLRA
jgi:LacI family transcriptional regulator